jgi:hypothetical protein
MPASPRMLEENLDPYQIALHEQLVVLAIRRTRSTTKQRRFWEPVLERVEARIARMIEIGNASEGALNQDQQGQMLDEMDKIHDIYYTELNRVAKENGKQGAEPQAMHRPYFVTLLTDPPGGTIQRIAAGRWSMYQFMTKRGRQIVRPAWERLMAGENMLFGKNWFMVEWPDGRIRKSELIRLRDDQRIVFRPNR